MPPTIMPTIAPFDRTELALYGYGVVVAGDEVVDGEADEGIDGVDKGAEVMEGVAVEDEDVVVDVGAGEVRPPHVQMPLVPSGKLGP